MSTGAVFPATRYWLAAEWIFAKINGDTGNAPFVVKYRSARLRAKTIFDLFYFFGPSGEFFTTLRICAKQNLTRYF